MASINYLRNGSYVYVIYVIFTLSLNTVSLVRVISEQQQSNGCTTGCRQHSLLQSLYSAFFIRITFILTIIITILLVGELFVLSKQFCQFQFLCWRANCGLFAKRPFVSRVNVLCVKLLLPRTFVLRNLRTREQMVQGAKVPTNVYVIEASS